MAARRRAVLGHSAVSRSPRARLPIWSWFCRNDTKAVGGRCALGVPRGAPPRWAEGWPLVVPAFGQAARQDGGGLLAVVAVVALPLAGQQMVQDVVQIVVPLRVVAGFQQAGAIGVVLDHEVHAAARQPLAQPARQGAQPVLVEDGVHGVQAQAVDAEFVQPAVGAVLEEPPHGGLAEVDRGAPGRHDIGAEERGRVAGQVVAVRAEVVADEIQHDADVQAMGAIDEALEVLGRAVAAVGRVGQHAVVAPVARAGEVGDGHQFDQVDAQGHQVRQAPAQARVAAAQAGVHFLDDRLLPGARPPVRVAPGVGRRIGHDAGIADVAVLQPGGRIGHRRAVGQAVAVARARRAAGDPDLDVALGIGDGGQRRPALHFQGHPGRRLRRPEAEQRRAVRLGECAPGPRRGGGAVRGGVHAQGGAHEAGRARGSRRSRTVRSIGVRTMPRASSAFRMPRLIACWMSMYWL